MSKKKPLQISQKRLVTLFKDIKRLGSEETRFCFLIGAGASKSSGIKTGGELAEEWYESLKEDLSPEELTAWQGKIGLDPTNLGASYPHIYQKRFESSSEIGYAEFKKLMENKEPGIGYVILSQILSNERHNFVITTNFDYLIEDSVRMYTQKKPFSAGHETLAEFISSQTERPTIIKVHRDLFLHPFNDESGTTQLKVEWENALKPILRNFNLLVIGYGGNDGSLMDYLKGISSLDRKPIYWCCRDGNKLNEKINDLLNEKDFVVNVKGFDELMISLNEALEYKVFENLHDPDNHTFVQAAKKRINDLHRKLKDLLDKLSKEGEEIDVDTKELFTGALKYLYEAHLEKDEGKKNEIYEKGLVAYPNDSNLIGSYAFYLEDIRKEYDKAEVYYKKAIELDPNNSENICNYAVFLKNVRQNYDEAEEYYEKAIMLSPSNADYIGNYALFIEGIREDYNKAEKLYKKAIEISPNANILGNYAMFLSKIRKDYNNAEDFFQLGLMLEPDQTINIGNYALFLENIRKDYDKAEEYYKKAIELDPNQSNNIGNYALFLENIRKDYSQAEEYYKKALEIDPNQTNNLGNYAIYLMIIREDYDKAEELYKRVIELDPKQTNNIGNYALFLGKIRKDYDKAEEYYKKAMELDSKHTNNMVNYASYLTNIRKDYDKAEELYNKVIEIDPIHVNNLKDYALFLKCVRKDYGKAEELYNKAMKLNPIDVNTIGLYALFLSDIRDDYEKAEKLFKRAIDLNPHSANNHGNYAHHLLIAKSDLINAGKHINTSLQLANKSELALLSELWFYRYAHYNKWLKKGEQELLKLISNGAKSPGWNLDAHVEIAKKNKHPNIKKLQEFADSITK